MHEYLYSLILVASAAAFSGFFAYSGSDRFHKFAVSAILFSASLVPLFSFISYISDIDISGEISGELSDGEFEAVGKAAFELGIKKAVAEREGIPEDSVFVTAEGFSAKEMRADFIKITLVGAGISVDFRALEDYIQKSGLGVCEVKYGFS